MQMFLRLYFQWKYMHTYVELLATLYMGKCRIVFQETEKKRKALHLVLPPVHHLITLPIPPLAPTPPLVTPTPPLTLPAPPLLVEGGRDSGDITGEGCCTGSTTIDIIIVLMILISQETSLTRTHSGHETLNIILYDLYTLNVIM